ncbi:GTP diphosphokinase [Pseudidiomarina taiwanensis]|uniref:GTP pyrophosphokinase n=1 Tax=Pseudidiomarina taiwanensis TaxID=337250 RepID=A0A432ZNL9_9GAMM|nr:GTP diphosphokinase [Pseudidiomarina taiwanensis]RUO79458.1 GTP diphosphokinase [Pseudidiomarina taiwanensis]
MFIRSTHVDKPHQQGDWLAQVSSAERSARLREHAQWLQQRCQKVPAALLKGQEMVEILAELNLDQETLEAALLEPAYEAGCISREDVADCCGEPVVNLLDAVEHLRSLSDLQHFQHGQPNAQQIDAVRRMLLTMVTDVRAVLLKLAERICFLREVKDADEETRVLAATACQEIYAPLANRLGIGQLKWELEDLSFRYLHPTTYKAIAKNLHERRVDRERYIDDFVQTLQHLLDEQGIEAEVYGRPKHIFSIWRKMQKKHLGFEQLYDIRAVRVITHNLKDCYAALGIVHSQWRHIAAEFDDYIATPKANGYQSIHTVVNGPDDKHVEIQIRTAQMHDDAELGVAAHWRYKEGGQAGKGSSFEDRIAWLRKLLAWQDEMAESGELVEEIRSQVFEDRVYVFTPKGEVMDLPAGATPLDFAYYVHSQVGHRCVGAKVDGRIVPFTYRLKNGERVEILTQKNGQPRRDWLNPNLGYLNTARARSKVQTYFKKLDRDKNLAAGKELLEAELNKLDIPLSDANQVIERFNMSQLDDLLAAIGAGDVRLQQVVNQLKPAAPEPSVKTNRKLERQAQQLGQKKAEVAVQGMGNLMVSFAKCCQPIPGDKIMGFVTQGRGVSVHRADCEQLHNLLTQHPERALQVTWENAEQGQYRVDLMLEADDRTGLLHDITTVLTAEKASVVRLDSESDDHTHQAHLRVAVMVSSQASLQRICNRLQQLKGVHQVTRAQG